MSDLLSALSRNPLLRPLAKRAGLPAPQRLSRSEGPYEERPFAGRHVACGAINATAAGDAAQAALHAAGASLADEHGPADLALFDASGMTAVSDLKALYEFFHPLVPRLSANARVLVLTAPPEETEDSGLAAARRAVEGFTRSLAKEIGKRGATANLAYVEGGAENRIDGLLRFLLSPRSAYVDGQPFRVSARARLNGSMPLTATLQGKRVLVTGAAQGLGAAIARRMAEEGARLVCLDIAASRQSLQDVADASGGEILLADVSAADAPQRIAGRLAALGGVDVIVHNAGVLRDKTLAKMDERLWDLSLAVNLEAIVRIDRELIEGGLLHDHGRLICLSSISGVAGNVGQTNYSATKAGVIGYVASRARQLAPRGITANAVAPGLIETPMMMSMPFVFREISRRMNSLSQSGVPRDVAELVTFLATPGASGVSGQTIRVCGQNLIGA
ncbi:3-oxoacyl-ACP reductase [Solimonas sp. K1W22B-7]|uniref:3-oxoacyl-ACP reductase n=1 Tax=Solimonas sp. K1W22B-7 TaxID=2303331 RepID=UPI000E32FFCD|nr:3-oxoacyl-ACP reductase [Solimonas sp. K1W22B-7]AXQ30077.1 3-oxoacyl-ACP reductase [Solimonas sp. K1W22B-7]